MEHRTQIQSDSLLLDKLIYRSLRDLHMMKNTIDFLAYYSCELPWFNTVFGRDNLIIAIPGLRSGDGGAGAPRAGALPGPAR